MLFNKKLLSLLMISMTLTFSTSASADSTWGGSINGELPFQYPNEIEWCAGFNYLDIAIDQNDVVWIATAGVGLICYDGKTWQHYALINGIKVSMVFGVAVDKTNDIWFVFQEHADDVSTIGEWYLAKYDGSEFSTYKFAETGIIEEAGLPSEYCLCELAVDNNNTIWFQAGGVFVSFDEANWLIYDTDSYGNQLLPPLTIDSMNRKWFKNYNGTSNGLSCFDGESWSHVDFGEYAQREGFQILDIAIDSKDNVWVNAYAHTLFKYDGDTLETVFDNNECESIWSIDNSSMTFDKNDVLWVAGSKSMLDYCLMSYDGSTWEKHFAPDEYVIPNCGLAVDSNGTKWGITYNNYSYFTGGHIESGNQTAVDGEEATPEALTITGVSPNPFNPETAISYVVPDGGHVTISVYDILGREIARLDDRHMSAGAHTTRWDGRDAEGRLVSSGTYICSVKTASSVATKKMTLMK